MSEVMKFKINLMKQGQFFKRLTFKNRPVYYEKFDILKSGKKGSVGFLYLQKLALFGFVNTLL